MAKEIQTQHGRCAAHGQVEATREIPKVGFPFVVYSVWRAIAQRSQTKRDRNQRRGRALS